MHTLDLVFMQWTRSSFFLGCRLSGVQGLYKAWEGAIWHEHDFDSLVLEHSQFGGASSNTHLVTFRGVNQSVFQPGEALPWTLAHSLNPASPGFASPIDAPDDLAPPIPRAPIIHSDMLRPKGLFDIKSPTSMQLARVSSTNCLVGFSIA